MAGADAEKQVNAEIGCTLKKRVKVPGYELTDHAADVVAEREIDITWVVRVLSKPEHTESDRSDPALRHALGGISERDGRVLRVVYNASVDPPRIVTVYFDRGQRGKT